MASRGEFASLVTEIRNLVTNRQYISIAVGPAYYDESEETVDSFIGDDTTGGIGDGDDDDDLSRPSFVSALPLPKRSSLFYTEKTLALSVVMTAIFALSVGFLVGFCVSRKYQKGGGGAGSGGGGSSSSGTASGISGSLYLSNSDLFEASGNSPSKR